MTTIYQLLTCQKLIGVNLNKYARTLFLLILSSLYADRDVNDIYNNIVRIIVFAAEECIPQTKTRRFKKRLP